MRAEVTVNGKVVGAMHGELAVIVLPRAAPLPDWLRLAADSIWRDGTGTTTVLIDPAHLIERS
jgi:hypothetical protein